MIARDEFISQFRGATFGKRNTNSSLEEVFQNSTLRPILKLQNELILQIFNNYLIQKKIGFKNMSNEKKMTLIDHALAKDNYLQNTYKGIVIALFTLEEYQLYTTDLSGINKRIRKMITERIQSQLLFFQ
jgi:hypothetical protein